MSEDKKIKDNIAETIDDSISGIIPPVNSVDADDDISQHEHVKRLDKVDNNNIADEILKHTGEVVDDDDDDENIDISNIDGMQQIINEEVIKNVQQNRKKRHFSVTIEDEEMSRLEFQQWTQGFLADDLENVDVDVNVDDVVDLVNVGVDVDSLEYTFPQTTAAHFTDIVDDKGLNKKRKVIKKTLSTKDENDLRNKDKDSVVDPELASLDSSLVHDAMLKASLEYLESKRVRDVEGEGEGEVAEAVKQAVAAVSNKQNTDVIAAAVAAATGVRVGDNEDKLLNIPLATEHGIKNNKVKTKVVRRTKKSKEDTIEFTKKELLEREKTTDAIIKAQKLLSVEKSTSRSFTKEETEAIDVFIKEYQKIHEMTHEKFLQRIWGNERKKDKFWEVLQNVLPNRTRSSLYKHVRRTYHIFEKRGVWTPEEDIRLAELAETCNAKWKMIGDEMKRMPEDCRDRWRNYVKCGSVRNVNKWTKEEEEKMKGIIAQILKDEGEKIWKNVNNGDEESMLKQVREAQVSPTINWTVISELMGGTRSRIQCRYKWKKIMKMESLEKLQSFDRFTKLWMLEQLKALSMEDPHIESNLDWNALALSVPRNEDKQIQWNGVDLSTCFQRMKGTVDANGCSFRETVQLLLDSLSTESYVEKLEDESAVAVGDKNKTDADTDTANANASASTKAALVDAASV